MREQLDVRETILCAHRDPAVLPALREMLCAEGWELLVSDSGFDAVRLALQHYPDVMLLDVALRDLDGYGVRRAVAKLLHCGAPPAVFLCEGDAEDYVRAFFAGGAGCLTAPFTPERVVPVVRQVLAEPDEFCCGAAPVGTAVKASGE